MTRFRLACIIALVLACAATGCATRFSSASIRDEIVRQQGRDPLSAFELNLGRFTTLMIKEVLAGADGELPFAGLSQLQLAVFEAPADSGPAIDVTRILVRGWEPVIRAHDPARSGMVLVRGSSGAPFTPSAGRRITDLVLVGSGKRQVIYARLRGSLDPELPSALGDALREGGPEEIRNLLTNLAEPAP